MSKTRIRAISMIGGMIAVLLTTPKQQFRDAAFYMRTMPHFSMFIMTTVGLVLAVPVWLIVRICRPDDRGLTFWYIVLPLLFTFAFMIGLAF